MDHKELIAEISLRTGIDRRDCERVTATLEEVLSEGLSDKKWKRRSLGMLTRMINTINARHNTNGNTGKK